MSKLLFMLPLQVFSAVDCDIDVKSTEPQGVHTAFAGDALHNIAISFFTCGPGGAPQVHFLPQAGEPGRSFKGTSSTYYKRHHHDVVLTGLDPGTTHRYTVGLAGGEVSVPFKFQTAPVDHQTGAPIEEFTALVVGDMGVNQSAATIAQMTKYASSINFTMHLGAAVLTFYTSADCSGTSIKKSVQGCVKRGAPPGSATSTCEVGGKNVQNVFFKSTDCSGDIVGHAELPTNKCLLDQAGGIFHFEWSCPSEGSSEKDSKSIVV